MKVVDTIKEYSCGCGCHTIKVVSLEPLIVVCEDCGCLVSNDKVVVGELQDLKPNNINK